MNEWLRDGRRIANQPGVDPHEKIEIEAHIHAIELSREVSGADKLAQTTRPSREKLPSAQKPSAEEIERRDPNIEWQRHGQNFLRYGFHIERGFPDTDEGRKAYLDTLPQFETQPKEYDGRHTRPMLVERKIPWQRQAQLAGIPLSQYLVSRLSETSQWEDNPHKVPDDVVAYTGWFNEWGKGDFADPIKPFDARSKLAPDVAGADEFEGIAQQIHFPEDNVNGKYFDLIGTQVGSDSVVYLRRWRGRPELHAHWGDDVSSYFRPLVRGSKIVTG